MGKLQFNQYLPAIIVSLCLCLAPVQVMAFDIYDDNHVPVTPPRNNPKIIDIYNKDGTVKLKTGTGGNNPVIYKDTKIQNKSGDVLTKRQKVALGTGATAIGLAIFGVPVATIIGVGITGYSVYQIFKDIFRDDTDYIPQSDGTVLHRGQQRFWYFTQVHNPASNSCTGSIHDSMCYSTSDAAVAGLVAYAYPGQTPTKVECSDSGCTVWFGSHFNGVRSIVKGEAIYPLSVDELEQALKRKDIAFTREVAEALAEALKRPEVWDKLNPAPLPDQYYDEDGKAIPTGVEHPYGKPKTSVTTKTDSKGRIIEKTETTTQPTIYVDPKTGKATFGEKSTTTVTQHDPETGAAVSSNTSTTVATDSKPEELEKDDPSLICKLLPNILACQELDTPAEQQIPKETKTVTLQEADLGFGGGSCPADAVVTLSGKQYTIVKWSEICPYFTSYVKPLVLLLSAFISMMIIFRSSNESGGGVV